MIRERRAKFGFTQESLADVAALHRNYVGSIERGERNINLDNLLKVSQALEVPLSTLIALAEARSSTPEKPSKK